MGLGPDPRRAQDTRELHSGFSRASQERPRGGQEARRDAEVLKRKFDEEAKVEAAATLERAKREIGVATDTAVKELYSLSAELATGVAAKLIRKELDAKDHERLIAESIEVVEEASRR